jgi:tetratricopeptide (TPR) repeat protein
VIPVFIPPYTAHFTIFPMADSNYRADIEFFELPPGFGSYDTTLTAKIGTWQKVDSLTAKGDLFDYSFIIFQDTAHYARFISTDSLTNFESIHYKSWILRDSYADYKWEARKGYLENVYNYYRKEHDVSRSGKLNLYVFPGGNNTPCVDHSTGIGYDFPNKAMYAVFNENFDSALPQYTQRYILYDSWGYTARSLVVGYSRYFLDDIYRARRIVAGMTTIEIKSVLMDEYPPDIEQADIICGAFVRFLVDKHSLPLFKMLYEKSAPGKFAFDEVYGISFNQMIVQFQAYQKELKLSESDAFNIRDIYTSQMWFDKALEYDIWLAAQPVRRDYHLKNLGATFFQVGNYAESETCYTALVRRYPDRADAAFLLGLALLRDGHTRKAIARFETVADSFPDAAKMLGEIYLDRRDFKKAEQTLEKVPEFPDSWTSILKARLAIAKGDQELADPIIKRALGSSSQVISLVPGEARGYIDAAYAYMLNGSYTDAESVLRAALFVDHRPYYQGAAYLALGRLNDLRKDSEQARINYEKAIETNSGEYINMLAKKYLKEPFSLQ